jgi:hypothetical protein
LIRNTSTFLNLTVKGKTMENIFYVNLELIASKNFTNSCEHGSWHYNNETSNIMIREIKEIRENSGLYTFNVKMLLSFANWTDCIQLYKIIHANNEPNWEEVNQYFIENAVKYFSVLTNCNNVTIVDAFEISTELERISTMQ